MTGLLKEINIAEGCNNGMELVMEVKEEMERKGMRKGNMVECRWI